ncbi:hypothetical protein RRG08_035341 [Elysia crispata]|uniref:Uncharacterized protein n=1 Tax=Elysia crispata TaxID=231223 RepID=A0AAE0Y3A3_9GAST|nr:hypothetical protein RRG08_035341 [Elysia crispata]
MKCSSLAVNGSDAAVPSVPECSLTNRDDSDIRHSPRFGYSAVLLFEEDETRRNCSFSYRNRAMFNYLQIDTKTSLFPEHEMTLIDIRKQLENSYHPECLKSDSFMYTYTHINSYGEKHFVGKPRIAVELG